MEKIFQPKIVWINPNDIHGVVGNCETQDVRL